MNDAYKILYGEGEYGEGSSSFGLFAINLAIKDEKPSIQGKFFYANNFEYKANERTDANTLYYYRQQSHQYSESYLAYLNTQAESIVAGITDDYSKVKAISNWVSENIWYDYEGDDGGSKNYFNPNDTGDRGAYGIEIIAGDRTVCGGYSSFTVGLLRAAGFPAREVIGKASGSGILGGHSWVEAYVDNRWVFMDPTWNSNNRYRNGKFSVQASCSKMYFDIPMAIYSIDHKIDIDYMLRKDRDSAWDGILNIRTSEGVLLKEVSNLTAGDLLPSTYGFDAKDLYKDYACTIPWNIATDRVDKNNCLLVVKSPPVKLTFDSRGGTAVSPIIVERDFTDPLRFHGVLTVRPADPVRDGYTFVGWSWIKPTRDLTPSDRIVDFQGNWRINYLDNGSVEVYHLFALGQDRVKEDTTFYAVWQENPANQVNPDTPKVNEQNHDIAVPTSSKVYVNGRLTEFEAYTINSYNYFKLRDLAKAVDGTDKNFEVTWDGAKNAINLVSNHGYTSVGGELAKGDGNPKTATLCTSTIYKDGVEISLSAYTIDGYNYFKLRDIAQAFNIGVTWDGTTNTIGIDTAIDYVP